MTTALDRPAVEPDDLSLDLRENMPWEEWAALGHKLIILEAAVQFWIGDWLNYGERTYGERYTQAVTITGRDLATLQNWKYVAAAIPAHERRPAVRFSHHAEVAALPADQRAAVLDRVETGGWSRDETREAARIVRAGGAVPPADSPPEPRCTRCGKLYSEVERGCL